MPYILLPEQEKLWLDANVPTKDVINHLQPVPGDWITWYKVSNRVNKVTENDVDLIQPV
jgi:putative SOS response-associated peptidase YedK